MRDSDAFETAYGRLAATRLNTGAPPPASEPRQSPSAAGTPRSRLLPRLALLAPKGRPPIR